MSRGEILRSEQSPDSLLTIGVSVMNTTLGMIKGKVSREPEEYLKVLWDQNLSKFLLQIDNLAEEFARDVLREKLGKDVAIRGEESSLKPLALEHDLAVLLDMVDGTDLLQRNLGNWCSAMVFFDPAHARVLCALIGTPDRQIYWMKANDKEARVYMPGDTPEHPRQRSLRVHKKESRLRNASVAYYGQKAGAFWALGKHPRLLKRIEEIEAEARKKKGTMQAPRFRIYNLAGNPMMMHLVEGDIDAIIECRGQKCHDVVPGLAIALKAGACVIDLDANPRKELTFDVIGERLRNPASTFRYVMASSKALAREIALLLD